MTTRRSHAIKPMAVLVGIGILVIGHALTQDSPAQFSRFLPFLLMMILGELVRAWTVGRLSPSTDDDTRRRRRRLGWIAGIAGIVFLTTPLIGLVTEWLPRRNLWIYVLVAASMVCVGVATAVMHVGAQASLDAKRAERVRTGQSVANELPGPLAFLLVFAAAIILFVLTNATTIETLIAHQALSAAQWVRVFVSAVLCGAFAFFILRKLNELADRPLDPTGPDLS